jgi:hypothetical protein
MTYIARLGPFIPCIGQFDTYANLASLYPANAQQIGIAAFCQDVGWQYSDGSVWRSMGAAATAAKQIFSTGGSGTASAGVRNVVLNGVNTTFALTFPAPVFDGQELHVNAATAVSVSFTTVATAPATTINTTPSTLAAGVGAAWIYDLASTTWFRL